MTKPSEQSERETQSMPMSLADYLLSHLAQECAEVVVRATKAQHFGLDEIHPEQQLTNRERLLDEVYDVIAMIRLLQSCDLLPKLDAVETEARVITKWDKAEHFRNYSRELGRLQ